MSAIESNQARSLRAKGAKMRQEKCDQCDEPASSFIGPRDAKLASFCDKHGRALTRANVKERGRILEAIRRRRENRRTSNLIAGEPCREHRMPGCCCGL